MARLRSKVARSNLVPGHRDRGLKRSGAAWQGDGVPVRVLVEQPVVDELGLQAEGRAETRDDDFDQLVTLIGRGLAVHASGDSWDQTVLQEVAELPLGEQLPGPAVAERGGQASQHGPVPPTRRHHP